MIEMRTCKKCGEKKELQQFPRVRGRNGKLYHYNGCKECTNKMQQLWRKNNSERTRFMQALVASRSLARRHSYKPCNATAEELKAAFTGFCHNPGCRIPEVECTRKLHIDHNHETGEFRGWLCQQCNQALGFLRDSVEMVCGLNTYLERSQVKI